MFYVFESAPSLPNLDFDEFLHFHILSYSTKSKYTRKMYSYEKIHLPISIILSLFVYTWLYKHCPSNIGVRSHKVKNPWTKSTHFLAEIRKVVLMCFGNKRWRSKLSKYIEGVSCWYFFRKIWFECFAYFLLPKQTQKGKIKQYNRYSWNLLATKKVFFQKWVLLFIFQNKVITLFQ